MGRFHLIHVTEILSLIMSLSVKPGFEYCFSHLSHTEVFCEDTNYQSVILRHVHRLLGGMAYGIDSAHCMF